MSPADQYKDLFTTSRDAGLWNDLYDKPTKVYHYFMAWRRNSARDYVARNYPRSARILDLGCGAGVLTELLLEDGFRPTACDLSQDMLELARSRLQRFPTASFRLAQADVEHLPFEDAEFDIVLCLGVLGYIENTDSAVAEIRRVIKPGGVLFTTVRNRNNELLSDPSLMAKWLAHKTATLLGLRWIKRLLTGSGLAADKSDAPKLPRITLYDTPGNVIRCVSRGGFKLEFFDGFGHGPLAIFGKELLSVRTSIRFSNLLDRVFRKTGLSALTARVADIGIFVFRKD